MESIIPQILDKDTNQSLVGNTFATDIENLEVNEVGSQSPFRGTLAVTQGYITPNHYCDSSFEDEKSSTIFEFQRDRVGNDHTIVQYIPEISQRQVVLRSQIFNFQEGYPVVTCKFVDKYLMFSDAKNPPRYFDWQKANNTGKRLEATILFGKPEAGINTIFENGATYSMTFDIPTIGVISTTILVCSGTYTDDVVQGAIEFKNAFNQNTDINPYFVADYCGCGEVKITEITPSGDTNGDITRCSIDVTNAPNLLAPKALVVYDNCYPQTVSDFHINRSRRVPIKAPIVDIRGDATVKENRIQKLCPQFAVRYLYKDKHISSPSPISVIPIPPKDCSGESSLSYNYVDIDFTDQFDNPLAIDAGGILKNPDYLQEIEAVEILVRDSNTALWEIAERIDRCEFGLHRQFYRWYNNGQRVSLPEQQSPDRKFYDAVPHVYVAEDSFTLPSGEGSRTAIANTEEGFDLVCPDLRAEVQSTYSPPCSRLYDVIIDLQIYCPLNVSFGGGLQAVWKHESGKIVFGGMTTTAGGFVQNLDTDYPCNWLPAKGFVGYLANTDYMCISKQVIPNTFSGDFADLEYGILDGQTAEGREGVRNSITDGGVTQRFIIKNVKAGRYSFRLASNMCSYGDELGKGAMYDLNKGRNYQNTSIQRTNEFRFLKSLDIEIVCPFDDTTYENGEIYIPVVKDILDLTDPDPLQGASVAIGYLKDANGINTPSELAKGLSVEGMLFFASAGLGQKRYPEPTHLQFTDHNGFFYSTNNQLSLWNTLGNAPSIKIEYFDGSAIKDFGGLCYEGGLQSFYDGTLTTLKRAMAKLIPYITGNPIPPQQVATVMTEYICYTDNQNLRNNAKAVAISIKDQNGNPLSNVPVALKNVGRAGLTDSLGVVEILKYSSGYMDYALPNIIALVAQGDLCCINPHTQNQPTELSETVTLPIPSDISLPTNNAFEVHVNYEEVFAALKRGERYKLAVIHYDSSKRSTSAEYTENSVVDIPFWTQSQNLNTFAIEWRLHSLPPQNSTYTHFQITIAKYGKYAKYLHVIAGEVKYYHTYNSSTVNVISSFIAGNASEVHISISCVGTFNEKNKNSSVQYEFSQGDRLRIIKLDNGQLYPTYFDVPITAYLNGFVVIKNQSDLLEIKTGTLIELYRENKEVADGGVQFFEVSQPYPIIEDGGIKYYGKGESFTLGTINIIAQDQSASNPYASGYLNYGDTYLHNRSYQTNVNNLLRIWQPLVESAHISDFWVSNSKSIGRINVENRDEKRIRYEDNIRYCNPYFPNTNTNGLCRFELVDRKTFSAKLGGIQVVAEMQGVLLCIGKTNSISVYLGKSQITTADGQPILTLNNDVLGGYNDLGGQYCTRHPLSFIKHLGAGYWIDADNKAIVKYTTGGIYSINKNAGTETGIDTEIIRLCQSFPKNGLVGDADNLVFCAVDKAKKRLYFRIADTTKEEGYTAYIYETDKQVWRGSVNNGGNSMSQTQAGVVSFQDGVLWEHDRTNQYNTFYGVEYPAKVTVCLNKDSINSHTYQAIAVYGVFANRKGGVFHAPVDGMVYGMHPLGLRLRESRINESRFTPIQGGMKAAFRKDINSPNSQNPKILHGEDLTCRWLVVSLICNNRDYYTLERIAYLHKLSHKRNI